MRNFSQFVRDLHPGWLIGTASLVILGIIAFTSPKSAEVGFESTWDKIDGITYRMSVPNGWLVRISQRAITFVPDAEHKWGK